MVPRLLLFLVAASTAQGAVEDRTGRIEGKVVFRDGLRPAAGFTVVAYPRCGQLRVTDGSGHYVIDGLRSGEYTVKVRPPGPRIVRTLGHYATASVESGATGRAS